MATPECFRSIHWRSINSKNYLRCWAIYETFSGFLRRKLFNLQNDLPLRFYCLERSDHIITEIWRRESMILSTKNFYLFLNEFSLELNEMWNQLLRCVDTSIHHAVPHPKLYFVVLGMFLNNLWILLLMTILKSPLTNGPPFHTYLALASTIFIKWNLFFIRSI